MQPLLQHLYLDHKNLLRLLVTLERQLDDFHAGQEHDLDLLCELVEYIASYEDQVHHPTEDRMFARMQTRTQEQRVALETLEEQHRILADMGRDFANSLESILHEGVVLRHTVEAQGRALLKMLRQHMTLEEQAVFPLAEQCLSEADWQAIAEEAPRLNDPIFGDPDPARFRTLFRHLSRDL